MVDMRDYTELDETGFDTYQPVAPEEEFFHSIYIAGQTRDNHAGISEKAEKFQIRGVEYNLDKVCMIITHVKPILSKSEKSGPAGKETVTCFSFRKGEPPWQGWKGRQCGTNSAERAASDFCQICRAQIIVTGVYCDENGKPILGEDKKPTFVFLRGKGMKYKNVADYLMELGKKELDPLIKPVTPESKKWEQRNVNNKRFVTEITVGEANSKYGVKKVFDLKEGIQLPDKIVVDILNVAKKTVEKFNEKFDWSKKGETQGYAPTQEAKTVDPAHVLPDATSKDDLPAKAPVEEKLNDEEPFDFNELEF